MSCDDLVIADQHLPFCLMAQIETGNKPAQVGPEEFGVIMCRVNAQNGQACFVGITGVYT